MGPTSCFLNAAIIIKMMEPGVGVRLQNAREVPQVLLGMLALMVGRISEPNRRWRRIVGGTVISHIGPQAPSFCFSLPRSQYRHRRIIGMEFAGGHHMTT